MAVALPRGLPFQLVHHARGQPLAPALRVGPYPLDLRGVRIRMALEGAAGDRPPRSSSSRKLPPAAGKTMPARTFPSRAVRCAAPPAPGSGSRIPRSARPAAVRRAGRPASCRRSDRRGWAICLGHGEDPCGSDAARTAAGWRRCRRGGGRAAAGHRPPAVTRG